MPLAFINICIMKKLIFLVIILFPLFIYSQSNWEGFGQGVSTGEIKCFYEDTLNDRLIIGGVFISIDTFQNNGLAVWDGEKWDCFSEGISLGGQVFSIIEYLDTLYVAGWFNSIGGNTSIRNIAKWDGNNWSSIGFNTDDLLIRNMRVINNELYIIGSFDSINNIAANGLAKYNGVEWTNVYDLPRFDTVYNNPNLLSDVAYYKGELYVGGNFYNPDFTIMDITKYNGSEWVDVGGGMFGGMSNVDRLLVYENELIVAGGFYQSDGNTGNFIQKWDSFQWYEMGNLAGLNNNYNSNAAVKEMKIHNGELYIGGVFAYAGDVPIQGIAKWDGEKWCGFGGDFGLNVYSLGFYRDTLFVGCGNYVDSIQVNRLVRWVGGNYIDTCSMPQNVFEIENERDEIVVYPNPTNEDFKIKFQTKINNIIVSIYNINGQKIYENEFVNIENEIIINNLKAEKGLYFVRIKTEKFVNVKKLILN